MIVLKSFNQPARLFVLALFVAQLFSQQSNARPTPTGTAFTYQGQLKQGGNDLSASADFQFSLWDAVSGPTQIGTTVPVNGVTVTDGLFTADLDFGAAVFGTDARWLEIAVRSPAGSGSFTTLTPRHRLQPAPVSQFALSVDGSTITNLNASNIASGVVPGSALSGTYGGMVSFTNAANAFSGSGAGLTSLNAANVSAGTLAVARGGTGASTAATARSNLGAASSGVNSDITSLLGLTTDLSVAQGGTGASTAATARTNLGAAASGANSDITSLGGLTTALSIAQGGTGATTAGAALTNLGGVASSAANTFTTGAQTIQTGAAANKGLIVRGAAAQTANLQEWQNSSSTVLASVSSAGAFAGDGSGLTALNASNLASGTVPIARVAGSYSSITGVGTLASGTWQANAVTPAFGGTGQSSYATGDLLYASGATTLSKLAIGAAGRVLKSTGSVPAWNTLSSSDIPLPLAMSGSAPTSGVIVATNTASNGSWGVVGEIFGGTGLASGVYGLNNRTNGEGVLGFASSTTGTTYGVRGRSDSNSAGAAGVYAEALGSTGATFGINVRNVSTGGTGVFAEATATSGNTTAIYGRTNSPDGIAVYGQATTPGAAASAIGVYGRSAALSGIGVSGYASDSSGFTHGGHFEVLSPSGRGVRAIAPSNGGIGIETQGFYGIYATAPGTTGARCAGYFATDASSGFAVWAGNGGGGNAVYGHSQTGDAIQGRTFGTGKSSVFGYTDTAGANGGYFNSAASTGTGKGVVGQCNSSSGYGVYAVGNSATTGTKSFQIDHPLDPAHKYLNHYSAEAPQPLNIYSGNVVLNNAGEAWVALPDYFESINTDFRYQLTCVGGYAPVYVAAEVAGNQFQIAGGRPGLKISWEVKAVRNDAWVRRHGAPEEIEKPAEKQGLYLHPELYDLPADHSEIKGNPATPPA